MKTAQEATGRLQALFISLTPSIQPHLVAYVGDYIRQGELMWPLEVLAESMSETREPLTAQQRAEFLSIATFLGDEAYVGELLAACPGR